MTVVRPARRWARAAESRLLRAGLGGGRPGDGRRPRSGRSGRPAGVGQHRARAAGGAADRGLRGGLGRPSKELVPPLINGGGDIDVEIDQLNHFEAALGRPLGFVEVFQNWVGPIQNRGLNALSATGAIPMINWAPPNNSTDNLGSIISGADDAQITHYADQLIRYGRPVFLRWFWEFNFPNAPRDKAAYAGCAAAGYPKGVNGDYGACYAAAWQRIYWIFKGNTNPASGQTPPPGDPTPQGAYNVAFVWCPGAGGSFMVPPPNGSNQPYIGDFFPKDPYVDWIGVDGYDRLTTPAAGGIDQVLTGTAASPSKFYSTWAGYGKPMMVGETGASLCKTGGPNNACADYSGDVQASFLTDMAAKLQAKYPLIHAVGYFDSSTNSNVWTLADEPGSPGLTALATIMATPYFSFVDP